MALKNDGEPSKYESKGDFKSYNEPSWVPDGKCKCCAYVNDDLTKEERRRTPEELRTLEPLTHTTNKNLAIMLCPVCDTVL